MIVHSFLSKGHSVVVHNTDLADRDKVLDQLRGFFGFENVVPFTLSVHDDGVVNHLIGY